MAQLASGLRDERALVANMLAIIGGSGLAQLDSLTLTHREIARTPWGEPSCALSYGLLSGTEVIFIARHGYGHTIPPHLINYRANLWALKEAGASAIIAVAAVGGIAAECGPGVLAVPSNLIDYTYSRAMTYFEGESTVMPQAVHHIDFTEPYDVALRQRLLAAAQRAGEAVIDGGIYGVTQGPRLETAAEIARMERDGCTLVGMTNMPEAALARELDIPYACLAVSVNHAAGKASSTHAISVANMHEVMADAMRRVNHILSEVVKP